MSKAYLKFDLNDADDLAEFKEVQLVRAYRAAISDVSEALRSWDEYRAPPEEFSTATAAALSDDQVSALRDWWHEMLRARGVEVE
jgi:hypothetical protein